MSIYFLLLVDNLKVITSAFDLWEAETCIKFEAYDASKHDVHLVFRKLDGYTNKYFVYCCVLENLETNTQRSDNFTEAPETNKNDDCVLVNNWALYVVALA